MALHIGSHVEQLVHQHTHVDAVGYPLLVVEKHAGQTVGRGVLDERTLVLTAHFTRLLAYGLQEGRVGLVQVVLQGLAHIVMETGSGIGSSQFLTLCRHRQYTADDDRRARVDGHTRLLENLGEVLRHAASDTVMLALANGGKVTRAVNRRGVDELHLAQHVFAHSGELALLLRLAQGSQRVGVRRLAGEPAGAVTSVVVHEIRLVALGGRCEGSGGRIVVVVQIVAGG